MIEFRTPVLEDQAWAKPILKTSGMLGCEYAFGTQFIWLHKYRAQIARFEDYFLGYAGGSYLFPAGKGDLRAVVQALMEDAQERGVPFCMHGVTPAGLKALEKAVPNAYCYRTSRSAWDYIYNAQDLIDLRGKKYHAKRNHIAKFMRQYSYTYEDLNEENMPECYEMALAWQSANEKPGDYADEMKAIRTAFEHYRTLDLLGGLIRVDGKVIAFTLGEEINSYTFDLHFEKALIDYEGAYALINREFAAQHLAKYRYINREEDLGLEGIRKAKLSYSPSILLEKGYVMPRPSPCRR